MIAHLGGADLTSLDSRTIEAVYITGAEQVERFEGIFARQGTSRDRSLARHEKQSKKTAVKKTKPQTFAT